MGNDEQQLFPETTKGRPKRFIKNQIPASITENPALKAAISLLPSNYNFEIEKSLHRIISSGATTVALQFPEGLLLYSLIISDIFKSFSQIKHCHVLADVTYGACCVDDFSAAALGADLLIHYGHSCLVPIDTTLVPCLYVFVEIAIHLPRLIQTIQTNFTNQIRVILAGTVQFLGAIRAAKPELEKLGFRVLVPQAKPLSGGEVLGCTAPKVSPGGGGDDVLVFVADGRFHLEAFMIANPGVRAFRYDPYTGLLFLEEYDQVGMRQSRQKAIETARREAKNWGIVLGTLGRQGNPRILDRLEKKMREKGFVWTVVLMSELSPARIALFGDSVDAWIQIACPRLSIDWGDAFLKPLLTPFEAEIALGFIPGWWEKKGTVDCKGCESGCDNRDTNADYPMDYYAQDGGEWNSSHSKKLSRPTKRNPQCCTGKGTFS